MVFLWPSCVRRQMLYRHATADTVSPVTGPTADDERRPLEKAADSIRIASWNLWSSPYLAAERVAVAAERLADVDVLLMQENQILEDGESFASRLAIAAGFTTVVQYNRRRQPFAGTAVLSRLVPRSVDVVDFSDCPGTHGFQFPLIPAIIAGFDTPSGRPLLAASAHLAWGTASEPVRLQQAERIARRLDELADPITSPGPGISVLGMDANAPADSETLRFLGGLSPRSEYATFFVDTFKTVGHGPGITSSLHNPHARRTALEVGITRPGLVPERRIDFLLARGYVHGRPGCPLAAGVLGEPAGEQLVPSDHYGVWADLWCPPVP